MKTFDNIFDYHINLHELPFILEKEYCNINNNYYLKNIVGSNIDLNSIINKNKKNIIINWKGNKLNLNENIRTIDLELLINILKKHNNLNYISINKNLNDKEKNILKDNNILDLSNIIDCGNNSFYDTITILNNIDLVVSTDTSIVHLAGSMGIETICLLSRMREWRWTNDNNTNWYPKMKLLRQNELLNWNNVLELLDNYLSKL
jgi:ADP-heptose:LPS heptosyltransferase